ncbi:MAG TPA: S8 family peptidase [Candidatus Pullilachnospira intestinigallinarum]|nr:S8 family peptidase [Candidatus Pullilachnospira intestinigallinarum]
MSEKVLTGKGVGVAILDTGIFPHIDFDSRIAAFCDFIGQRKRPYDDNGHGTHVAGLIMGSGKGSKGRYAGAAPQSHAAVLKVLDRHGNGSVRDVMKALRWVKENGTSYGIRIINISVGTIGGVTANSRQLVDGVEELWDEGYVVVTAAGNMGPAPGSVTAPGSSRKVITVGSSDLLEGAGGISGSGPTSDCVCKPDVVAPGARIISCAPKGRGLYAAKSGTSMSTPQVSGAIALLLEREPQLTNVEVKMLLRESAVDLGYHRNRQGWGLFRKEKFLSM